MQQQQQQQQRGKGSQNTITSLLFVGAGCVGKSTIFKQLQVLFNPGLTEKDCMSFRAIINENVLSSIRILLDAANELNIPLLPANQRIAQTIPKSEIEMRNPIPATYASDLHALWSDPAIQQALARSSEFEVPDSASYFYNELARIASPEYLPTQQDVLRARLRTTGMCECDFWDGNVKFNMVDTGGERSERKKWMFSYNGVTSVIFVAALSDYTMTMYEDTLTNRLQDSLSLFEEIYNNKTLRNVPLILFLNKKDLFAERIKQYPLRACFSEYKGENEYAAGVEYISNKFVEVAKDKEKQVYVHTICAVDTEEVEVVFHVVKDIVLRFGAGIV